MHNIVEITWIDSASARGWMTHEEALKWADEMPRLKSVGIVIRESEDQVLFCSGIDNSEHKSERYMYNGVHFIPKFAIIEQKTIGSIA